MPNHKLLTVSAVLVALLVVVTISVLVLFDSGKSSKRDDTSSEIKEVTSYSDGDFLYNCSRPISARRQSIPVPVGAPAQYDYIPIDKDEARLFCYSNAAIENEGKISVLQRPEVLEMIRPYAYHDVSVKALEFERVKGFVSDQSFAQWLAEYQERGDLRDREIGCIIVVETPGLKKVYFEDEKLEVLEELDYAVFEHYLTSVNAADRQLFLDKLQ